MLDGRESVQHGHDLFSKDLNKLKRSPSGLSGKKSARGAMSTLSKKKENANKKAALELYRKIDDTFLDKKPKDPHKVIDKKT